MSLAHDPHSQDGCTCPRNRFGFTDYAKLPIIEAPLVAKRGGELEDLGVTGSFDPAHLRAVHRYLFQDVFPWAGDFRVVNLSKGNSMFGPALHIAAAFTDTLAKRLLLTPYSHSSHLPLLSSLSTAAQPPEDKDAA